MRSPMRDVIYAGDGLRGYGNVVILRHDQKMTSLYAHNSELKVHQGDHVTQGTADITAGQHRPFDRSARAF